MADQQDLLQPEADAPTLPVAMNTEHARNLLRRRYPAPEWALLEEVAPHTGGGTRYADAIAVNLWRSRGHAIHGFEIKVSRSDWLRELKQPEKAEPLYRYCDHWHIVAPKDVVKPGELPPTWGLLVMRDASLVEANAAPRLTPEPITREFFASLMRRGHETVSAVAERMQRAAVAEAQAKIDKRVEEEIARRSRRFDELKNRLAKFEEETGISLDAYRGPQPATIKLAQKLETLQGYGSKAQPLERLLKLAGELEQAATQLRDAVAETGLRHDDGQPRQLVEV